MEDRTPDKKWPNGKDGMPLQPQIANFSDLLERATNPNFPFINNSQSNLKLSASEKKDVKKIHSFRNDLAHIKPNNWSVEVVGLPRMAIACINATAHLFENSSQIIHLTEKK